MTERHPVTDASAWKPEDLEKDRSWQFTVTAEHADDLERALADVKRRGLAFAEITAKDFLLPTMKDLMDGLRRQIKEGRGIATLSGIPTDHPYEDLERLYWGLCTHLGIGVTQNLETGLIHYITDGDLAPKDGARMLGKPRPSKLHVDLSDAVGLFCVRQAPDEPMSLVASSMTVYNEILEHHPEYLPRLEEGFFWNRKGPSPNEKPHSEFKVPAWSEADGVVSCRFHTGWIRGGQKQADQPLTEEEDAMFSVIEEISAANALSFPLKEGEIAFWNNYTTFHGRDGFAETDDESQKRVLLRIWFDMDEVRPFADEGRVRYGAVRHGQIGWTAADVLAGNNNTPHQRDEEGVPVVG
jgi:hypothetical protein